MKSQSQLLLAFIILIELYEYAHCLGVKPKLNYEWTASIDDNTGLASSLETSLLPSSSLVNDGRDGANIESIEEKIQTTFSNYPRFLGRKRISFGLLSVRSLKTNRNVKTDEGDRSYEFSNNQDSIVTAVCLSLPMVNISLLTFGQPEIESFTQVDKDHVVTNIPILGGLLSCHCQNDIEVGHNDNIEEEVFSCGSLRFELVNDRSSTEKEQVSATILKSETPKKFVTVSIETQIKNYQPAIAGCAPMNPLRKMMYLSIQRPIHAYVMWRFHRYCYKKISSV